MVKNTKRLSVNGNQLRQLGPRESVFNAGFVAPKFPKNLKRMGEFRQNRHQDLPRKYHR
jgi:hypothetical protein